MTKTVLNLLWNKISKNFSTKKLVIDALANKQDLIIDIATIRSNSLSAYLKPSTGIPAGDLASGVVPTNVSSFTNDAKYVTEDDMQVDVIDANGHDYVDLGLPSGTLWATMNIGANSVMDNGLYFSWGGTTGYTAAQVGTDKNFSWRDYELGNASAASAMTKYNSTDGKTVLEPADDAAVVNMGGNWHMPTEAQFQELLNTTYVTNAWVTDYQGSGVNGRLFTSVADNTKTLFFPAAGYCSYGDVDYVDSNGYFWSRSVFGSDLSSALNMDFYSGNIGRGNASRYQGYSVRGVLNASKAPKYATKAELAGVATSGAFVIETTYADLVTAKNGGTLTKGAWYRITDYVTTTAQSNIQSAGHAFDVIVRADSESVLNENAFAIQHTGDTYFANQKLSAWLLKYDINNDTNKYAWADATNGKGVIYYMKDENDNECPYDFKNIQFKVGAKEQAGTVADVFYFTFSVATGENDATVTDHSLNGAYCYGNKMGVYISSNKHQLNSNIFRNISATLKCNSNKFGDDCSNNTFGNYCSNNTFGNTCGGNTFGNRCESNTFGNNCDDNVFGGYCTRNIFRNSCESNKFGDSCSDNIFGNYCNNNTFGDSCEITISGNYCSNNTLGNDSYSNTFGNYCSDNTFGTASAAKDYYQNIIFENGVQYVLLDCTQTTSYSACCQNVLVGMGIKGTSSSKKTLTVATAGNAFKTMFKTANDVEIDA